MTYKILSGNPRLNTHEFFVDTVSDLQYLPIEPASSAVVATTGDIYLCGNNGKWVTFNGNGEKSNSQEDDNSSEYIIPDACWVGVSGSGVDDIYKVMVYTEDGNHLLSCFDFPTKMEFYVPQNSFIKMYYDSGDGTYSISGVENFQFFADMPFWYFNKDMNLPYVSFALPQNQDEVEITFTFSSNEPR